MWPVLTRDVETSVHNPIHWRAGLLHGRPNSQRAWFLIRLKMAAESGPPTYPRTAMNAVRILPVILLLSLATISGAWAQSGSEAPLAVVQRALSRASVDSIIALSSDRIEIAVLGKSKLYSKAQARYVLKDFFDRYPPVRVTFRNPSATDKGIFAAGSYRHTADGEPLRVYVRLRRDDASWSLREIVVEKVDR